MIAISVLRSSASVDPCTSVRVQLSRMFQSCSSSASVSLLSVLYCASSRSTTFVPCHSRFPATLRRRPRVLILSCFIPRIEYLSHTTVRILFDHSSLLSFGWSGSGYRMVTRPMHCMELVGIERPFTFC